MKYFFLKHQIPMTICFSVLVVIIAIVVVGSLPTPHAERTCMLYDVPFDENESFALIDVNTGSVYGAEVNTNLNRVRMAGSVGIQLVATDKGVTSRINCQAKNLETHLAKPVLCTSCLENIKQNSNELSTFIVYKETGEFIWIEADMHRTFADNTIELISEKSDGQISISITPTLPSEHM